MVILTKNVRKSLTPTMMMTNKSLTLAIIMAITLFNCQITTTQAQGQLSVDEDFSRLLGKCKMFDDDFDSCMKDVFNDLRAYFPTGICIFKMNEIV